MSVPSQLKRRSLSQSDASACCLTRPDTAGVRQSPNCLAITGGERVGSLRSPPVRTRRLTCGDTPAVPLASTNAVRTLLGRTAGLAVGAGGPVVCCPFRPALPPRRRAGDLTAAEFGGVRHLELSLPLVYVGLVHRECLVRCRFLAVRDPGELDVLVHGQVDHLAGGP